MTVGILGAGQLGRMLALAGFPMGEHFVCLDPTAGACAGEVAEQIVASYEDGAALDALAGRCKVVTCEFENVPAAALQRLAQHTRVFPPPRAVELAQDRLREKELFRSLGIATVAFAPVDSRADLHAAVARLGLPAVLKTRRFGYDGKGQYRLYSEHDIDPAWQVLGGVPLILEGFATLTREVSTIAVRSREGAIACYPVCENEHREGVLRVTRVRDADPLQANAQALTRRVLEALDYVGVLTVEWFDCNGELLANELAPRVHNSGHWSIEGAVTSQFANHLRAILGLPLGSTRVLGYAAMVNILGRKPDVAALLGLSDVCLHWYGKGEKPGRKLGHVTIVAADSATLEERVARVCHLLEAPFSDATATTRS